MSLEIKSKENPVYKELKKISREKNAYVLIEGKKLFFEAKNSSLKIEKVFIDDKNKQLFSNLLSDNDIEVIYMDNNLIASVFTTDSEPEAEDLIVALAKRPSGHINELFKTKKNIVLLENIQDPGNLGAIIRSSLAFNTGGIILFGNSVDPFNTKVVRASAGAVFHLPVVRVENIDQIKEITKKENYKIIATAAKAKKTILEVNKNLPNVFLFGNEGSGLSKQLQDLSDEVVAIPHSAKVESLNLGVAVSIVLWELQGRK